MRHFEKLSKEEVTKLGAEGGSKKNPNKGTGSLPKAERVRRAREAANKRWRKDERIPRTQPGNTGIQDKANTETDT